MIRTAITLGIVLLVATSRGADTETENVDDTATHRQTHIIKMVEESTPVQINAFCLNKDGQIVAICGSGPGEVRVLDDQGNIQRAWPTEIRPEAVTVADNGNILIGGEGKLFRFDAAGKELYQAEAPHAHSLRTDTAKLRKEAITLLTRRNSQSRIASRIKLYEQVLEKLEEKGKRTDLNDQEMKMLEVLPKSLQKFQTQLADELSEDPKAKGSGPSEEEIQNYIENIAASRMRISSISASGEYVFVATQATAGFGYDVWRTDHEFDKGEVITKGLRGCCGQMDVQCCEKGVFVAENSRHRVVRYDADGKKQISWGKQDRNGEHGFSGCCNPMNVCFNGNDEVFTAESGSGRIKRFDADGNLLSVVGEVQLTPGCKNVSIAASPMAEKVYVLDVTRNQIVMLQAKSANSNEPSPQK